ncbi:ABC transporter substrate-binding protein [Alicyclobacillus dauci]|uniref:Extracellular solute-binding protein n=1 Tax=Alicyclobacillus dauci TaxID=1475485 RepID=A0ABY6Z309_9BACL|nr:extracellular solute-binding protein [Alicyclobacillus dauci]WAH37057.1 extracellular solute-binding protein [Alicyclobacillus dauci]
MVTDSIAVAGFQAYANAFHAKYPNVTVQVTGEDFNSGVTNAAHILQSDNAPDIVREVYLPNLVKDHLVLNLDPYAKAYGWDKWPQSQFDSMRVSSDGSQMGTGSIYGVGPGFGLTGIYYNKDIASKLGITSAPKTLSEFEADMAKAKAANIIPFDIDGKDTLETYPLQNLIMDYAGSPNALQDWINDKPGASINTPATIQAAKTLKQWYDQGYIPQNLNSQDLNVAINDVVQGKALFFPDGNWAAPIFDQNGGKGKIGFFLFPSANASDPVWAMSAPDLVVIPAKAKHPDVAAAFLNFVMTDETARQATVAKLGFAPAGPANGSIPPTPSDSAVGPTVTAFNQLLKSNGLVGFMANATPSMSVSTLFPETQLLIAGKTTTEDFASKLQSDYQSDLGAN